MEVQVSPPIMWYLFIVSMKLFNQRMLNLIYAWYSHQILDKPTIFLNFKMSISSCCFGSFIGLTFLICIRRKPIHWPKLLCRVNCVLLLLNVNSIPLSILLSCWNASSILILFLLLHSEGPKFSLNLLLLFGHLLVFL